MKVKIKHGAVIQQSLINQYWPYVRECFSSGVDPVTQKKFDPEMVFYTRRSVHDLKKMILIANGFGSEVKGANYGNGPIIAKIEDLEIVEDE